LPTPTFDDTKNPRDTNPFPEAGFLFRNLGSRPVGNIERSRWFDFAAPIKYIFAVFFKPFGFYEEEA
jgi:hypothetical protein